MIKFVSIFFLALVTVFVVQNVNHVTARPDSPRCPVNQTYQRCGYICPSYCNIPAECEISGLCAPPRCECSVGYSNNTAGNCVLREDCEDSEVYSSTLLVN